MADYKAVCSDCPNCGKESIVFLAYAFRIHGEDRVKRVICHHCLQEYDQALGEMALRPKTKDEIEAIGGEASLGWI